MDIPHTQPLPCPGCGTVNKEGCYSCRLCSEVLRKLPADTDRTSLFSPGKTAYALAPKVMPHIVVDEDGTGRRARTKEGYVFAGIGMGIACVFHFIPILGFFNWFLSSLFHEMGHCFFAWVMGQPAFPAISLSGHAAAVHQGQSMFVTLAVFVGLATAAWHARHQRKRMIIFATLAVLQPLFAFSNAKEILFLLGGHIGELAFGSIFLWRAFTGGFTENKAERILYGVLAWQLIAENVILCWGLIFSASARLEYAGNGSFGLTNDYLRLANDHLGVSLGTVAFGMLVLSLLTTPLAWWLGRKSIV